MLGDKGHTQESFFWFLDPVTLLNDQQFKLDWARERGSSQF